MLGNWEVQDTVWYVQFQKFYVCDDSTLSPEAEQEAVEMWGWCLRGMFRLEMLNLE